MPLHVRCKSKSQAQNSPFWPQALPCHGFLPLFNQQQGSQQPGMLPAAQQTQSSPCSTPIIVQAPAPAAPIVIQSPPIFIPVQSAQSADCAENAPTRSKTKSNDARQQSQGGNMPVFTSDQQDAPDIQNQSDDIGAPTANSAQRQSARRANSGPNAAAQPIIINIHNSQDTASNNRSLFAPKVHDESSAETRLNLASRSRRNSAAQTRDADDSGISPVPVIKTPIPETSPGASLDPVVAPDSQNSEIPAALTPAGGTQSQTALPNNSKPDEPSPRFMLVRHGRLVHVRPVKATVVEGSSNVIQAQTPARTRKSMYHYVGWS